MENQHVDNICKKANSARAFLQRNTNKCPRHIKSRCYTTYVRPTMEYASTVWDPSTPKKNTTRLEAVQRRSARYVYNNYDYKQRVTPLLESLNWQTLQSRRQQAKAAMMYRIVNGLVAIPTDDLTPIQNRTRGHETRFLQPHTRIQAYKYSFFPSAIKIWNTLPQDLTSRPSLESFQSWSQSRQLCCIDRNQRF